MRQPLKNLYYQIVKGFFVGGVFAFLSTSSCSSPSIGQAPPEKEALLQKWDPYLKSSFRTSLKAGVQNEACLEGVSELFQASLFTKAKSFYKMNCQSRRVLPEVKKAALIFLSTLPMSEFQGFTKELYPLALSKTCGELSHCSEFKIQLWVTLLLEGKKTLFSKLSKKIQLSELKTALKTTPHETWTSIAKDMEKKFQSPSSLSSLKKLWLFLALIQNKTPSELPPKKLSANPPLLVWIGDFFLEVGNPSLAEDYYQAYLKKSSTHDALFLLTEIKLGKVHRKKRNYQEAEEHIEEISEHVFQKVKGKDFKKSDALNFYLQHDFKTVDALLNSTSESVALSTLDQRLFVGYHLLKRTWNWNLLKTSHQIADYLLKITTHKNPHIKSIPTLWEDLSRIKAHLYAEVFDYPNAIKTYLKYHSRWNRSRDRSEFLAKLGLWQYLAQEFKTAEKTFKTLRYSDRSGQWIPFALFHRARSLEQINSKKTLAKKLYQSLVKLDFIGYYGHLAKMALHLPFELSPSEKTELFTFQSIKPLAQNPPFSRNEITRQTWLYSLASTLTQNSKTEIAKALMLACGDSVKSSNVASYVSKLSHLSMPHLSLKNGIRFYGQLLNLKRRTLATDPEANPLLPALFPMPWKKKVFAASQNFSVPPSYLYAIMRRESRFSETAVSSANAYGLMQLTWKTAKAASGAAEIDLHQKRDLLDPTKNIPIGAAELASLLEHFENNLILASSAYNAGKRPVESWVTRYQNLSKIDFIELIPYRETRSYVKETLANYWNYLRFSKGKLKDSSCLQSFSLCSI